MVSFVQLLTTGLIQDLIYLLILTERGRDCPKVASWTEGSLAQENDICIVNETWWYSVQLNTHSVIQAITWPCHSIVGFVDPIHMNVYALQTL